MSEDESVVWNSAQYDRFSSPRLRPALELLDRIEIDDPRLVYDLGCGSGEITVLLAERYRAARVVGLDSSTDMLEEARKRAGSARWEEADIGGWKPPTAVDLIYSNAALQWLANHETLFPRLLAELERGGILAVQMPLSWPQPSHRLMRETLEGGGENGAALGSEALRSELARPWVLDSSDYYRILAPHASALDVWTTEYLHVLEGEEPVLEWVKGTGLRPILNGLDAGELEQFLRLYRSALQETYPRQSDGTTLYPFRRLFLVARR